MCLMARKCLSSQVIEELDRTAGLLRPVQDIVDPMTSHMVGAALDGIQRALDLCYAARTTSADTILPESPLAIVFEGDKLSQARHKAPASTRRPRTPRKSAGEK